MVKKILLPKNDKKKNQIFQIGKNLFNSMKYAKEKNHKININEKLPNLLKNSKKLLNDQ